MRLWASIGLGAAAGAGAAAVLRWVRSSTPWEPTEDDGVLEARGETPWRGETEPPPSPEGRALLEQLGHRGGMTPAQVQFLVFVASKESRFWPADRYEAGHGQPSFDKQFVRDYLETLDWDKTAPGPDLPAEIIEQTADKYREALEKMTSS